MPLLACLSYVPVTRHEACRKRPSRYFAKHREVADDVGQLDGTVHEAASGSARRSQRRSLHAKPDVGAQDWLPIPAL